MRAVRNASRWHKAWLGLGIVALAGGAGGTRWQLTSSNGSKVETQVLGAQVVQANGNGATNGNGSDPKGSFTVAGQAQGLYPGAVVALPLTVSNPQSFGITVNQLTVTVQTPILPSPPLPGVSLTTPCTAAAVQVGSLDSSGRFKAQNPIDMSVTLGKNGSSTLPATAQLRMVASPPDACQGATFPLSYGGSADKS